MILILVSILLLVGFQTPVTLTSPAPFQVFQRSADDTGSILISGHVEITGEYSVSASWNGIESGVLWQGDAPDFSATWAGLPVWQSDLIVTVGGESYTVPNVGIGDVYVIAGQSNAVGAGSNYQMYMSTLGFRAGMLTLNGWAELADPTGKSVDTHARGSAWPLLATYIQEYGVPVAFIPLAVGGTKIATWQPGKPRFERIRTALNSLPAPYIRAVLWQQGEFDSATPAKQYSAYLSTLAGALYTEYGVQTFAAHLWNNPKVNNGIDLSIQGSSAVLAGADLRDLPYDGGSLHYTTDANLQAEAWRWFVALSSFYPPREN